MTDAALTANARPARAAARMRPDLQIIADMVEPGSRVLDVGCGDGTLLDFLVHNRQVVGRGMELSQKGVNASVSQGLSVIQGNADTDLKDYPDRAFEYVILSQTLQATHDPREVLEHLVRIGHYAIVSFPNFAHWRARLHLLLRGRMPVTEALPEPWFQTPNIHLCTICDFVALCRPCGIAIERFIVLDGGGRPRGIKSLGLANLLGEQALFLLRRDPPHAG